MLERSKAYVGNAQVEMLINYDRLKPSKYGKNKFEKRSKIITRQFNTVQPTFASA